MQITITSTLTEEEAILLAKEKGWQETITSHIPSEETKLFTNPVTGVEDIVPAFYTDSIIPNPQSPFDFLKSVYTNMIKDDAKTLFIRIDDSLNIDKKNLREQLLKDRVDAAFLN